MHVIKNNTDYSPFGAIMPGRNSNPDQYRYGFNGKRKDPEMYNVSGSSYDFDARLYNSRLGRFMSTDPHQQKYAMHSPYSFCFNNSIIFVDNDGKDGRVIVDKEKKTVTLQSTVFLVSKGTVSAEEMKALENHYNIQAIEKFGSKNVTDENGDTWVVTVDVKFVYSQTLDNLNDQGLLTMESNLTIPNAYKENQFQLGDNIMEIDVNTVQLDGVTNEQGGMLGKGGKKSAIHESLHMLGFDERYNAKTAEEVKEYKNDPLSNSHSTGPLMNFHYADILDYALKNYNASATYVEGTRFLGQGYFAPDDPNNPKPGTTYTTEGNFLFLKIDNTEGGQNMPSKKDENNAKRVTDVK